MAQIFMIKALHSELFSVKALSTQLQKLMELTKQLIAIIIVSFAIAVINGNNRDYKNSKF
jgi:hypothetical protein